MNKKLIALISAVVIILPFTTQAKAETLRPTLAIMDVALDTSLPAFEGKIIQEVCILEWDTCPNGTSFMEGPGASTLSPEMYSRNNFDHGTQMVSAAISSNPNMNIVFIRIAGQNINGDRQISGPKTVTNALEWVISNRAKYNIQAVSMSQGDHNLASGEEYCPNQEQVKIDIQQLIDAGVPTFFAVGNNRDYQRIDWPSCVENSIAVGAATKFGIELYTNNDSRKLDFFAPGSMKVYTVGGSQKKAAGTSISTQVAASQWLQLKTLKPELSYSQIYESFLSTAISVKGRAGTGLLMDISKAFSYIPLPSASVPTTEEVEAQKAAEERSKLEAEVSKAIADAETQYQLEVKAASEKLANIKLVWLSKLNG